MIVFVADPLFAINHLTLVAATGIAGGLYLFVRGFRLLARKRLLLNTPTSKIRSASLGLVEVSGLAAGPYTVPAPITGAACFLYRTTAWQKSDESKTGDWKKVAEEELHLPFFLNDGTGQLLIEPKGADLDLYINFRQNYSDTIFSPHATQPVLSFLARHGVEPSNKIRIEECSIQPGNPLFIVGTLAENPGVDMHPLAAAIDAQSRRAGVSPQSSPAPEPEVVWLSESAVASSGSMSQQSMTQQSTQQSRIAAALSKAGINSPAAWKAAGVPYQVAIPGSPQVQEVSIHAAGLQPMAESLFQLNPPVVLMKGENNPAFLISWRSQKDLVRGLAWKSATMIWGGGALALLGFYVLLQQFELL